MNPEFSQHTVATSRLAEVDFANLAFGKVFSDHMVEIDYRDGAWQTPQIKPYGPISLMPANTALHYGQAIFEGMKATKHADGRAMLFRPELHARRLNNSAARLAMPQLPEALFLEALHRLVDLDQAWIPPAEGSSLYIRPFMFACDNSVGVRPASDYKFMIITSPVGPYYSTPVRLLAQTKYIRAAEGGVGEAKAAGNYAAAMLPSQLAQAQGYDQILWLDAKERKYVQEVGTMNIFFVVDGKVITPSTDAGTILRGITRMTILDYLRESGTPAEERAITIDELVVAHKAGKLQEAFGSGTAAVVSQVESLTYEGYEMTLPPVQTNSFSARIKDQIEGVRSGRLPDVHGYLVEAGQLEPAAVAG